MRLTVLIGALLMLIQAGAAAAQARIGAPIEGLPGSIWADANNDGYVDGYVYNGQYYAGTPSAYDPTLGRVVAGAAVGGALGAAAGAVIPGVSVVQGAAAQAVVGSAIAGLPGGVWADRNNDGYVDGYVYNGEYYRGAPSSLSPATSLDKYLLGRELLEDGKARSAAEVLLENYRSNPRGERAPHSLYYLGQALMQLRQSGQACKAYAELEQVYGTLLSADIRNLLPSAKTAAKCPGSKNDPVAGSVKEQAIAQVVAQQPQPTSVAPAIASAAASSGPRYALIIGNSQYGALLGRLPNPVNDAQSVAAALRAVGFNVDLVTDADQRAMKRAISRFGERLSSARGATGLFYYAGHGIQSRGTNYLIPVSAPIEREPDLDLEAVAADTVLAQMEDAGAATSIVILDACRNMPLARSFRSSSRGLARMDAPNGSFIAYSTAPGATAADGDGRNSPFAAALVRQIGQKGLPIEVMFRGIRKDVLQATGGQQTPWDSSSLVDPFYFVP